MSIIYVVDHGETKHLILTMYSSMSIYVNRHDITEILLKVALNNIKQQSNHICEI